VPGSRPTIADLLRPRQRWARERGRWWAPFRLPAAHAETDEGEAARAGLAEVAAFGPNPGALRMLARLPEGPPTGVPLVVVLHGCTQSAAAFDRACGWSDLAARLGFALLLPEQRRANNPKRCFNWFAAGDTRRDAGEVLSIRSMVARTLAEHDLDPGRVYVAGLSAGGAMAAAMLAASPDVFAGGAIIGGVPYGAATNARQARPAMAGRLDNRPAGGWGDAVRAASPHRGPWPQVSVWHGDADRSVHLVNAERLVEQWTELHGVAGQPAPEERDGGHLRRVWRDADGKAVVEAHAIAGMGHGAPIRAGTGPGRCGVAGPATLDVGVSSTHGIVEFWGLASRSDATAAGAAPRTSKPDE
jgi:poly(hydroxyalkanoate) depolymerase family esterase